MGGPLTGIRVIDLTWILSGPYTTMILCDLGAEVIKIERPGTGDIARGNRPFIDGVSSYFLSLNRRKKSVAINLASEEGKEIFLKLVETGNIVVENFVPGTMKKLGLNYEVLKERNPRIIYAAISGYGQNEPYALKSALDVIIQAAGGIMSITGEPGGPPVKPGASLGDIIAGLFTAISILTALEERHRSGEGQMIDISMLDCQVAVQENAFERYFATGEIPRPLGTRHPVFVPFQAFATKDGYIVVAIVGEQWPLFCAAIDRVDLIDDERFKDGYTRTQNYAILEPILTQVMKTRTTQEWAEIFESMEISCGPVNTIDKVVAHPQIQHRNMIIKVPHPKVGEVHLVNTPIKLLRTPSKISRPSPELGEHTEEVLRTLLGFREEEILRLKDAGIIQLVECHP